MMKLNNKGFSTLYVYLAVIIAVVGIVGYFWLTNKALKAEVKQLKAELETCGLALDQATETVKVAKERLVRTQGAHKKAIAEYQGMLNECISSSAKCEVVKIEGCPQFAIIEDPKRDLMLQSLYDLWRRAP